MKKPWKTVTLLFLILIATTGISLIFKLQFPPEPIWKSSNSMYPDTPPAIVDTNGDETSLFEAIEQNIRYLKRCKSDKTFTFGTSIHTLGSMLNSVEFFKAALKKYGLTEEFYKELKNNFRFFQSSKEVLFTGYYESRLKGSLQQTQQYRFPLYSLPEDIINIDLKLFPDIKRFIKKGVRIPNLKGRLHEGRILPYFSRKEIDIERVLANRNLEILWVDDRIELFFLQIQGSGIVSLEDGREIRVNYAGTNGHPYKPIGRYLLQKEAMKREEISMQSIRRYLLDNPGEVDTILNYNTSVVFFRTVEEGPIGAAGVPLTAMRCIATDSHLFPRGAICMIETELPIFSKGKIAKWVPLRTFVFNMDTGGAIKSPGRCDIFTGNNLKSRLIAGHMNKKGRMWFLVKSPPK